MELDSLTCSICCSNYDHGEHEPKVIPGCGHTLCGTCISNLINDGSKFECPFCKKSFKINKKKLDTQFLRNFALLHLLDEKNALISKDPLKSCPTHNCPIEIVCIDCSTQICYKCAYHPSHKNHEHELIDNFFSDVSDKVRDIEDWARKMVTHNQMIQRFIDVKHDNIIRVADTIATECITKISDIVEHFYENIRSYFKDLKEGKVTRLFPKLEENIFSTTYIEQITSKLAHWKELRNLESGLGIKAINLKRIKDVIEDCEDPKYVKDIFNSLENHFVGNFFNTMRTTIQEISALIARREYKLDAFYPLAKYTKVSQEILVSTDAPKKGQKKIEVKNFKENISKARKIILELKQDQDFSVELKNDLVFGLWEDSNIRAVSLKLSEKSINENLWSFSKALPCLLDIKVLSIQAKNCNNFNNDSIKAISDALSTMKLRKLEIEAPNTLEVDDEGLKSLGFALSNLQRLKGLSLVFDDCIMINDNGFSRIAQAISKMRFLNQLKLSFQRCSGITSEGINSLAQALTYAKELTQIDLFLGLTKFDDEAMSSLCVTLGHLSNITQMSLDVHGCSEITDTGIEDLADCISELQALQKINFCFMGCEQISHDALSDFDQVLNGLPDLRTFRSDLKEGRFDHKVVQIINEDDDEDAFELFEDTSESFNDDVNENSMNSMNGTMTILKKESLGNELNMNKEEIKTENEERSHEKITERENIMHIEESPVHPQPIQQNKPKVNGQSKEIIILDDF